MEPYPEQRRPARRIPTWALVLVPVLAVAISNADVVFLMVATPGAATGDLGLALSVTVPLSIGAGVLTLWILLRLRREVDLRAEAEQGVRAAMVDLGLALDRERLLRRELDHRVRNNLSALLALVAMYEESKATPAEIVESLRNRVLALRESFRLIATTHGEGVELGDLLRAVVAVVLSEGATGVVSIEGPSVRLTSREANAFAMIAQELLTNATKHGALRDARGKIGVTWRRSEQGGDVRIAMRWVEGPVIDLATPPVRGQGGMGLSLIQGFAASDLRGGVSFSKSGEQWIVDLLANVKVPSAGVEARTGKEVCV
jgi:two-component sensor histidine kinase